MEERIWEEFSKLSLEEKTRVYFRDKIGGKNSSFYHNRSILVDIYEYAEREGCIERSDGKYVFTPYFFEGFMA